MKSKKSNSRSSLQASKRILDNIVYPSMIELRLTKVEYAEEEVFI